MSRPPPGSSPRLPTGWRTSPTSSPTTTRRRSSWPRPPDERIRRPTLRTPAFRFLTLAGERALELDTVTALDAFERALALTSEDDPQRPDALSRFGEAAFHAARYVDADAALEEAITVFRARGDTLRRRPRPERALCGAAAPERRGRHRTAA